MAEFALRPATADDAGAIRWLIINGGINPTGLDWKRFIVALAPDGGVIGCGQIKPHGRDVLELASIAVRPEYRHRGIASAIIERLLQTPGRPLYLMCRSPLGPFYARFGFQGIPQEEMPTYFRRISKLAGMVEAMARAGDFLLVMKLM